MCDCVGHEVAPESSATDIVELPASTVGSPEQSQSGDDPISTDESQGGATSKGNEADGEEV